MNHHGNKQRKSGVTACTTVRQVRLQPPPVASSLAIRHWGGGWPPALLSGGNGNGGIGPFGTGGDTHTHIAVFGAVSPSKVVVRPGASSSVLTPRGTLVQKTPIVGTAKNY